MRVELKRINKEIQIMTCSFIAELDLEITHKIIMSRKIK